MKNINIETKKVDVVSKIEIDGKSYPIHEYNIRLVNKYLVTKDPKVLESLSEISLEI